MSSSRLPSPAGPLAPLPGHSRNPLAPFAPIAPANRPQAYMLAKWRLFRSIQPGYGPKRVSITGDDMKVFQDAVIAMYGSSLQNFDNMISHMIETLARDQFHCVASGIHHTDTINAINVEFVMTPQAPLPARPDYPEYPEY